MIGKPSKNKHSYNVYISYAHDIVALTMRVTIIDNQTHNINNKTTRRRSVPIYGVYFEDCFFSRYKYTIRCSAKRTAAKCIEHRSDSACAKKITRTTE